MTAQKHLFTPPPALGNLSDREQAAYELLQARPTGVTSTELGRHVHVTLGVRCPCSEVSICFHAMSTGEQLGKQLRRRQIAVKRGNTHWTLTAAARPRDSGELPESF